LKKVKEKVEKVEKKVEKHLKKVEIFLIFYLLTIVFKTALQSCC
jgi:hypothetical protein